LAAAPRSIRSARSNSAVTSAAEASAVAGAGDRRLHVDLGRRGSVISTQSRRRQQPGGRRARQILVCARDHTVIETEPQLVVQVAARALGLHAVPPGVGGDLVEPLEAVAERSRQEAAHLGVHHVGAPRPHGEDERLAGHGVPQLGQIVDVGELPRRGRLQRRIADDDGAARAVHARRQLRRRARLVARLAARRPPLAQEQPRQGHRRARRLVERHRRQLVRRHLRHQEHRADLGARADAHVGHGDEIALPRQRRDRQERQIALALGEPPRALRRRAQLQLHTRRCVRDQSRDQRPRVEERRRRQPQLARPTLR